MWPPSLHDDLVRLRPLQLDDREPLFATLSSDRGISRWTRIPWPYERVHLDQFFALVDTWRRARTDAAFAVTADGDDTLVGCIGVHRIGGVWIPRSSFLPDEPGYWLAAPARGRGLMTRSLRLVCAWLFDDVGRPQVNIQTKVGNIPSRAVVERVGFRYTGTVAASEVDDDPNPADHDRYLLTRADMRRQ